MPNNGSSFLSLENIIKYLPEHVYWLDRNNIVQGCNELQAKALGVSSADEARGRPLQDFFIKETAEALIKANNQVMTSGIGCTIEEEAILNNNEKRYYLSKKIPLHDNKNNTIGLLGISFDITDRKLYEQNLVKEKTQAEMTSDLNQVYLDNILFHLPEHFYWIDREGKVIGCNDKQAKTFGFNSAKDLIGKTIYDVAEALNWDKSIPDIVRQHDKEVMNTGKSIVSEEEAFVDGKKRTYLSYKNPLIDNKGNIIGILGVTVDITERKEAEEALRIAKEQAELAVEAKNEFIANMSHDLRTPFNGILGLSQILAKKETNSEKKELLNEIADSAKNLLSLLNEILDIASLEGDGQANQRTKFNFYELIDSIYKIFIPEAKRKNLELIINYLTDIPKFLIGDKLKLHRIVLNLIGNAIKFTNEGHVTMLIDIVTKDDTSITLNITIEDTGIGIPKDKQKIIFDRFTRLSHSHNSPYKGVGLGLYIVARFISDLNGKIVVESEIGQGTKFICTLPFEME